MRYWPVKSKIIPGKTYSEVNKIARRIFHVLEKQTKRKPYIRSKYFKKQKVFLSFFWDHLAAKRPKDKLRRMKYFECALEVIQHSTLEPEIVTNPNNKQELLYRFYGKAESSAFVVQIKRDKRDWLELMSIFPK